MPAYADQRYADPGYDEAPAYPTGCESRPAPPAGASAGSVSAPASTPRAWTPDGSSRSPSPPTSRRATGPNGSTGRRCAGDRRCRAGPSARPNRQSAAPPRRRTPALAAAAVRRTADLRRSRLRRSRSRHRRRPPSTCPAGRASPHCSARRGGHRRAVAGPGVDRRPSSRMASIAGDVLGGVFAMVGVAVGRDRSLRPGRSARPRRTARIRAGPGCARRWRTSRLV